MSLAFLSKKSWHTANLSNQEKVWMAEQKKEAEEAKLKEITKQIQVEREREELERISGRVSSKIDRGIDWMYEGGGKDAEEANREAEEYLLGKAFEGSKTLDSKDDRIDNVISSAAVAMASNANNTQQVEEENDNNSANEGKDWNEEFRLRYEDPMFLVSQKKQHDEENKQVKRAAYEKVSSHKKHKKESKKPSRRSRSPKRSKKRSRRSPSPTSHHHRSTNSKYGLQSSRKIEFKTDDDLRPEGAKRKKEKEDHHDLHRHRHRHHRPKRSAEDRAKALQEMQSTADARSQHLYNQAKKRSPSPIASISQSNNKSFVNELMSTVNGVLDVDSNHVSMADRIHRKRHTNQKLSEKFL